MPHAGCLSWHVSACRVRNLYAAGAALVKEDIKHGRLALCDWIEVAATTHWGIIPPHQMDESVCCHKIHPVNIIDFSFS